MCQKNVKYLFTVLDKYFSRLNFKNVYTTKNIDFCNFQHFFSFFSFPSLRWRIFLVTLNIGWCIFRPTQIHYTPLLTYAKYAILHIRPTSTWFYSCFMHLWPQRPAPSRGSRPPSLSKLQRSAHKWS